MPDEIISSDRLSSRGVFPQLPSRAQETNLVYYGVQLEELEHRVEMRARKLLVWNGDAFVGTDELKLRWLSERRIRHERQ